MTELRRWYCPLLCWPSVVIIGEVAIVSAAQFVPYALLALPAGVWADRLDRRTIIVISDSVRLLCQVTVAVLLLSERGTVPQLIAIAAVYGAADAFFTPAFTGLFPAVVSRDKLQQDTSGPRYARLEIVCR